MTVRVDPKKLFADAMAVWEAWKRGMSPTPEIGVSQWADENRELDRKSSNIPGRWSTARTPYSRR